MLIVWGSATYGTQYYLGHGWCEPLRGNLKFSFFHKKMKIWKLVFSRKWTEYGWVPGCWKTREVAVCWVWMCHAYLLALAPLSSLVIHTETGIGLLKKGTCCSSSQASLFCLNSSGFFVYIFKFYFIFNYGVHKCAGVHGSQERMLVILELEL